ncbi:MAG TPA: HK97 family phage prohead protease [Pirellulales bacterium]|nr:HK97 family phage prohead protease [Pirellulales bacterium]
MLDRLIGAEIRSDARGGRCLVWYAAVFDRWSELTRGHYEIFDRRAFDKVLASQTPVRALINHNSDLQLRSTADDYPARLVADSYGLRVEVPLIGSPHEARACQMIRDHEVRGGSLAMRVGRDRWQVVPTRTLDHDRLCKPGALLRTIVEVEHLAEVTLATRPVYRTTALTPVSDPITREMGERLRIVEAA